MGKTKDLGHLASMALYDVSGNMTLPAGLKINGSADVATQSYVGTQLGSYTPSTRSITINGTTYDLSADRSWTITSMIYPAAGIAVSTGSAWGTSITNNSTNWNTAYGWGNHASAGYLTSITSSNVTTALGFTPYNSTNPSGYITSSSLSSYLPLSGGTMSGVLTMGTSGTNYIRMGAFPNSTSNSGEAWIGRASDRNSGTMTVQLGGGSSSSRSFEVVDYAWTTVLFSVGSNGNISSIGTFTTNTDASGASIIAQNNGNSSRWYGRIGSFNSTSDKAAFIATYGSVAVVGAHNNALTAWANLYVNNVDGANGGNVYLPTNTYIASNIVLHAGNYSGYAVVAADRTNWSSYSVINNVVGQLAWKNYGNNHTIIDASAGTAPNGASINNTNANTYWTPSYPTLMGWNGSSTYGVRVDTSRYADSAGYADSIYYAGAQKLYGGSDGTRNIGWAYHNNNATGLHWPNNGWHIFPADGADFRIHSGNTSESSLRMETSGTIRGYVYVNSSNQIGFLNNDRAWVFKISNDGNIVMDYNYGVSITGVYSSVRFQGVWSMGNAYRLATDGSSTGSLYGLAWSHPNAGGQAGYLSNHGLIHMMYGTAFATISDQIWCRGNITAYSDIRVKENIEVIPNAMEKINAIRGVTFTRNDVPDATTRQAGVIAQEVEKVLPEVITTNRSNGHLSVAYGNMVGLTIEGLKEHDIKINEQQKTIGILLDQIEYLKTIINGITK